MRKIVFYLLFAGVVFSGFFLRFINLSNNPPSLNWDEISFGYNAYSILKTGHDEFGKFLPVYFESLDDFKLPVHMYLTVVSESVFGLTDFAVRFPSAFLGSLTVVLTFLLAFALLKNKSIALISSFLLAILPWNIQFSRMAAEANTALFFFVLGVLTFLYGLSKSRWFLILSMLSFGLAQYTYLSFRVIVPPTVVLLIFLYRKELWKGFIGNKLPFVVAIVIFSTFFLSVMNDTFLKGAHVRFIGTNVLNDRATYVHNEKQMFYDAGLGINLLRRFFHDSLLFNSFELVSRGYLTHFSPDFLFFDLGQKHHHAPRTGLLYLWMVIFIPLGLYFLFRRKNRKPAFLILGLLLLASVPPAVTWDIPHAIRAIGMTIPITVITAAGIYGFFEYAHRKSRAVFYPAGFLFSVVAAILFVYFFHQYHVHLPNERSENWIFGRREAVEFVEERKGRYDKIIVSTSLEWPHVFFLFYSGYDPQKYLQQGGTVSGYWDDGRNKYDNYEFHKFTYEKNTGGKTLFVGKPGDFPVNAAPLKIIYFLDKTPAIYIVEG